MIIEHPIDSGLSQNEAHAALNGFRSGFYRSLSWRADVLFELTDAILCAPGPVTDLARLSLEPVRRRGHGALYDAMNAGLIDTDRLGLLTARTPMPRVSGPDAVKRLVLAVDVSNWLRPDTRR